MVNKRMVFLSLLLLSSMTVKANTAEKLEELSAEAVAAVKEKAAKVAALLEQKAQIIDQHAASIVEDLGSDVTKINTSSIQQALATAQADVATKAAVLKKLAQNLEATAAADIQNCSSAGAKETISNYYALLRTDLTNAEASILNAVPAVKAEVMTVVGYYNASSAVVKRTIEGAVILGGAAVLGGSGYALNKFFRS